MFNQLTAVIKSQTRSVWHVFKYLFAGMLLGATLGASAQKTDNDNPELSRITARLLKETGEKAGSMEKNLAKSALQYLNQAEATERKIRKKLAGKDSAMAAALFDDAADRYVSLRTMITTGEQINSTLQKIYLSRLDTLHIAFNFLSDSVQFTNLPEIQEKISRSISHLGQLQNRFNQGGEVKKYLEQRKELLQQQLNKYGFKELKKMRKHAYYYQAQLQQYKTVFNNPSRLETEAVDLLKKIPQFNRFFQTHSMLAGMFRLPGNSDAVSITGITGLQSREAVMQSLVQRMGSPAQVQQLLHQQLQEGTGTLPGQLKLKLPRQGGNGDGQIPGFQPNNQKIKRFADRLQFGTSMQTVKSSRFFPSATDIGLSVGYKLNDKSVIGLGGAYKIGWGKDIRYLRVTQEGVSVRSFVDYRIKGDFWLSGGAEMNYRSRFHNFEVLDNYSAWQKSALLGLGRKYRISHKLKGNIQLLYDFLWKQQVPRTQPVVFRIGYSVR